MYFRDIETDKAEAAARNSLLKKMASERLKEVAAKVKLKKAK